MLRVASIFLLAVASALSGCNALTCTTEYRIQQVTVVDANGMPVAGATVTATNPDPEDGSGHDTQTTQADGIAYIGETVGGGVVEYRASLGSRQSSITTVTWTCDRCHCSPAAMGSVTLVLP
jgi:hypothetical protein